MGSKEKVTNAILSLGDKPFRVTEIVSLAGVSEPTVRVYMKDVPLREVKHGIYQSATLAPELGPEGTKGETKPTPQPEDANRERSLIELANVVSKETMSSGRPEEPGSPKPTPTPTPPSTTAPGPEEETKRSKAKKTPQEKEEKENPPREIHGEVYLSAYLKGFDRGFELGLAKGQEISLATQREKP
jgi:hypothetical protein